MDNKMFGFIKHSSVHCKMGCEVLTDGYEVFRQWVLEHTGLAVYSYITIQSMASSFMLEPGCYDNAYQISGAMQQFISKCVVGGRVITNSNKQYHVKKKIADFDACSLYPSATHFMGGLFKDKPTVLCDKSYEFLKQQDEYFVRIKNIKLKRHLDFPLTSNINGKSGVRDFITEMENAIIYIDKVGLEEIITYQEAEFGIIDGYY